jgi:carbonic anhydrase/acetyltransferase-like protein (isoleucine patch superfamily)
VIAAASINNEHTATTTDVLLRSRTKQIGEGSSIGDGAVVHVAKFGGDLPTVIGAGVTVGAKAIIHACTLQDGCYVGAGATVLDGATVEQGAVLAAGALAGPRSVIPAGQVSVYIIILVYYSLCY